MSDNKQLTVNMIASVVAFVASYAINFMLTPYIVRELGTEAYGFVSLGTQIIGYTSLATIALNSMAGRYVAIEYHKNELEKACRYFSSVFYGNCLISSVLFVLSCILVLYLEFFINIPDYLVLDVKFLFAYLSFNSIIGLMTNVYSISTFIKNRLDYTNIRNVIGNIIRAVVLIVMFSMLAPKIWYFGFTGLIVSIYVGITNIFFSKKYTPQLIIDRKKIDIDCIKNLLNAGVWNLISRLSLLFETGLNLLMANIFIGAKLAGIYALCSTLPVMISSICSQMSNNFAPTWTKMYADGNQEMLLNDIHKSLRIMGFLSSIPMSMFIVHGETFYKLWLPSEDSNLLYCLSICGSAVMFVAMPLEPLWNVFTITNKVKQTSINLLEWSIAIFVCVLIGICLTSDSYVRLFVLASVKTVLSIIRTLTFLPIYGAECLGVSRKEFYIPIIRNFLSLAVIVAVSSIANVFQSYNWLSLCFGLFVTGLIGLFCNYFLSLNKDDRTYLISLLKNKINKVI